MREILAASDCWANETFPESGDHAKVSHLREEFAELVAEPSSGEELADVLMILSHLFGAEAVAALVVAIASRRVAGIADEVARKLEICRARTWGPPDANGVCHSVRREAGQ